MEVPATPGEQGEGAKTEGKSDEKKATGQTREGMSNAASEILRKMMRRPK
jgi:hypothetical protein